VLYLKDVIFFSCLKMNPLIVIPARMGSTRLPQKPLALINREPMVVHVWRQACAAQVAPVIVACDHPEIAKAIEDVGGTAVLTQSHHATGSDRLAEAVELFDPQEQYSLIINVQGDLPVFPEKLLPSLLPPFQMPQVDIVTFIQSIEYGVPHSVKVHVEGLEDTSWFRCLDFSRKGNNASYIHLGIYAFRRNALKTFASLAQTEHERSESLEQLRALDHGMMVAGVLVGNEAVVSVDTPQDLEYACQFVSSRSAS